VKSVTGKEIQYPWVVYSSLILFHLYTQSKEQNTYFASTKLLCGSFLDLSDSTWMHAVANADIIHCDNWNWWKGDLEKKNAILPHVKSFSSLQKSIDSNVAYLVKLLVKTDAYIIVYNKDHFQLGFECLHSFDVHANWNSVSSTSIHMLKSINHNILGCDSETLYNSIKSPDEISFAKKCLQQRGFYCGCGMPLIRLGRIAAKDNYTCMTCEVRRLFSVLCILCDRFLQKCICTLCCQVCMENNHDVMNMNDTCEIIRDIGSKRRADLVNLKLIVQNTLFETPIIVKSAGIDAHDLNCDQLNIHSLTLKAKSFPFICVDQARILSFLTLEELRALATERRSMNRLLETFEIALEGNPGKHSGVSRALFDSLDEMKSIAIELPDKRLQDFRAVRAFNLYCKMITLNKRHFLFTKHVIVILNLSYSLLDKIFHHQPNPFL
jgi:hypothetical protein